MRREPAQYLAIEDHALAATPLKFLLQPIVSLADGVPYGFELLYRGPRLGAWSIVDAALLRHLCATSLRYPRLFINMANETLLGDVHGELVEASARHDIVVELSEARTTANESSLLATKVNALAKEGVQLALDDFGAGQDGLQRLFTLNGVSVIKLDGELLRSALVRRDAADTLHSLVRHWKERGIQTVAECVENERLFELAHTLGVDMAQGYFIDDITSRSPFQHETILPADVPALIPPSDSPAVRIQPQP